MASAVDNNYRRISIRGVTCIDSVTEEHTIRVFAQVEGATRQAIATQGDQSVGFSSKEDACGEGCRAACERAAVGADALGALDDCRQLCETACRRPDPNGKFSNTVSTSVCEGGGGEAAGPPPMEAPTTRATARGGLWGSGGGAQGSAEAAAGDGGGGQQQSGSGGRFTGLMNWPAVGSRRD